MDTLGFYTCQISFLFKDNPPGASCTSHVCKLQLRVGVACTIQYLTVAVAPLNLNESLQPGMIIGITIAGQWCHTAHVLPERLKS